MNALALAATGTTYTDSRGSTWHADLINSGTEPTSELILRTPGNPEGRTYEEIDDAFGPLVRSSFTASELATIAEALADRHDQHEPLEGGPAATLRPRLAELVKRAQYVESLLPTP